MTQSPSDWLPAPGQALDVLAVGRSGDAICGRALSTSARILVRTGLSPIRPVEGELFTLDVSHRSFERGFWVLAGTIRSPRLDEHALRLEPLALLPRAITEGPNGRRGSDHGGKRQQNRLQYELETIIPRVPGFRSSGRQAIEEIAAFWGSGDAELAEILAGELLARDLRCLEAHALLGGFFLDGPVEERWTERALRHYRVGATIGERSLAAAFDGTLPWRWRGNRPFLRCLYGYARCLERVGDAGPARDRFERLLRLAPDGPMEGREALDASDAPPP